MSPATDALLWHSHMALSPHVPREQIVAVKRRVEWVDKDGDKNSLSMDGDTLGSLHDAPCGVCGKSMETIHPNCHVRVALVWKPRSAEDRVFRGPVDLDQGPTAHNRAP